MLSIKLISLFLAVLLYGHVVDSSNDPYYENNMASWQCKLPYGISRHHISSSFAHCFKDPSKYCRQHSVSMNACKHHTNMGLYCCSMQTIGFKLAEDVHLPSWMTKDRFLEITSDHGRPSQMFLFFAMDIKIGGIESAEEMAVFLSLVMMDTNFLSNMEEHIPEEIMKEFDLHKQRPEIKYVGRGAIHVKGADYYKWITSKLNEYGRKQNQTGYIDVYRSPDSLMFPTAAFSSAALIWNNSYSVLTNRTKEGKSFKTLSDGSVGSLAQILYHLKGDVKRFPDLMNIWKRIRLVLKAGPPIPRNDAEHFGPRWTCMYEPQCKGFFQRDDQFCPPRGLIKRVPCEICPRDLRLVLIIDPDINKTDPLLVNLTSFIDRFTRQRKNIQLFVAQQNEKQQTIFSEEFNHEDLHTITTEQFPSNPIRDLTSMINASAMKLAQYNNVDIHHKNAILVFTETIRTDMFTDSLQRAWLNAELEASVNTYVVYYRHNQWLQRDLLPGIQSKLFLMESDQFLDGLCNDPQVLTMNAKLTMSLKRYEKRSIIVRVSSENRRVNLDIIPVRGQTDMIEIKKHQWTIPFDGEMKFDHDHSVRRSLNIVDDFARFKGNDVIIKVTDYSKPGESRKFLPASFDTFVMFEGIGNDNMVEIRVVNFTVKKEISNGQIHQRGVEFYELSCIVATCLLVTACSLYLPFSFVIIKRVKHHLKRLRNRHDMMASSSTSVANPIHRRSANKRRSNNNSSKKTSCQTCSEKFPEENSELSNFFPQEGCGERPPPPPSAPLYQREVRFQSEYFMARNGRRCRECTERKDMTLVSYLHVLRLVLVIVFELMVFFSVKDIQGNCQVVSAFFVFFVNFIMFVCFTEMLCYTELKEVPRFKAWWSFGFLYCVTLSLGTELTRISIKTPRMNCWPIDSTIQGKFVIGSSILIALMALLICIYYFLLNGRECHTKTGFTLCLMFVVIVSILLFNMVETVVEARENFIIPFIFTNILTALTLSLFSVAVQSKLQKWNLSRFFTCGMSSKEEHPSEMARVQHSYINDFPQPNKRSGSPGSEVTVKTTITLVSSPQDDDYRRRSLSSVSCSGNSDLNTAMDYLSTEESPLKRPTNLPLIAEHNIKEQIENEY